MHLTCMLMEPLTMARCIPEPGGRIPSRSRGLYVAYFCSRYYCNSDIVSLISYYNLPTRQCIVQVDAIVSILHGVFQCLALPGGPPHVGQSPRKSEAGLDTPTEAAISAKGGGETTCREMLLTRTRRFITRASRQSLLTTPAPWHVVTPFPELPSCQDGLVRRLGYGGERNLFWSIHAI